MNHVTIMGRITKDLEVKTSQTGSSFMSFTVAVNRAFVKQGEEKQTDFINCKAFGKTADNIARFFKKGSLILIEGRIQTGSYENKEKVKIYTTDVMVDGFHFTGEKKQEGQTQQEGFTALVDDGLDELPF